MCVFNIILLIGSYRTSSRIDTMMETHDYSDIYLLHCMTVKYLMSNDFLSVALDCGILKILKLK